MRQRSADRLIGILVTVGITTSLSVFALTLYRTIKKTKENGTTPNKNLDQDLYHKFRHAHSRREDFVRHYGSCHCGLQQFAVEAPRDLAALEAPSALRYPYIMARRKDFHMGQDDTLSCYFVGVPKENVSPQMLHKMVNREIVAHQGKAIGAHLFCSVCGTHVVHAPCVPSEYVHVNVHCLRMETVENLTVAFHPGDHAGPGVGGPLPLGPDEVQGLVVQHTSFNNFKVGKSRSALKKSPSSSERKGGKDEAPDDKADGKVVDDDGQKHGYPRSPLISDPPIQDQTDPPSTKLSSSFIQRASHPAVQMVQYMTARQAD